MITLRIGFLLLVLSVAVSSANEEEFVPWQSLTLDCGPIEKAGKVTLKVSTDGTVFKSFEIAAFDRTHRLTKAELDALRGFPLDSIKVTHSAGYAKLGGHGVYFKFRRVFYDADKGLRQQEVSVTVHENRKVRILGPREIEKQ